MRTLILLLFFMSCSDQDVKIITVEEPIAEDPVTEEPADPNPTDDWTIVFEENFDNSSLNQWSIWEGGAFNDEIQLYRRQQLNVMDGILTINAQREAITGDTDPFTATQKEFEYVSGRLETNIQFGPSAEEGENVYRIMARIKMPSGNGMWPAFWTVGDDWPTNGEIDIVEARGNEPMEFSSNIFFGTALNVPLTKNDETTITEHQLDVDITADFHTYELIWREDSLEVLFDGELLKKYEANSDNFIASLFDKKHAVVLNCAVGGLFFPPNADSADFADEASMQIDWVRVFKQ